MSKPGRSTLTSETDVTRGKAGSLTDSELADDVDTMAINDAGPEESTGNKAKMVLSILRQ